MYLIALLTMVEVTAPNMHQHDRRFLLNRRCVKAMTLTIHLVESLILDKRECIGMVADDGWGGGVCMSKLEVLLLLMRVRFRAVEGLDLK